MRFETELERGSASAEQVREAWAQVLADAAAADGDVSRHLASLGTTPSALAETEVTVEERSGDLGATILVAVVGGVATHVLKSLWDDFVRPRLRARFSVDVGNEVK